MSSTAATLTDEPGRHGRQVLIHIGYHKAGSSWLQKYLFSQPDYGFFPLCPVGTALPDHKKPKYLARYFIYSADGYLLSPFEDRTEEVLDQYEKLSLGCKGLVPVLSSERLSGNPHAAAFDAREICDRLHKAFPQARVLVVIREQVSMILSTYFQYLGNGGHRSLRNYMATKYDGRRPGFGFSQFEYDKIVGCYRQRFSPESVLTLPFEMFWGEPEAFIGEIGAHVGAEIPAGLPFTVKENEGLPRMVASKTRYLNLLKGSDPVHGKVVRSSRADQKFIKAARRGLAYLVGEGREKAYLESLKAECREICGDRFIDSNRRVSELIGRDLHKDFGYM